MQCTCTIKDYDSDTNEFYKESRPKASKDYTCCECGDVIQKGDEYNFTKGRNDGMFWTYKTCMICVEIRSCFFCTWIFEEMFERLNDEVGYIELSGLEALSETARQKFFERVDC